ncbi:MAG TPA: hypothetical protein VHL08_04580 [Dongiaceae bacterium]|jgi:hypothetical protein|nr:hypothetical protein [Dongiaceae bacterium]
MGLFGSNSKSKSTSSSNSFSFSLQNSGPWQPQQPYLLAAFQDAQNAYNQSAPSNQTIAAWKGKQNRALTGSPLVRGADDYLQNIFNGTYLNQGNPYFQKAADLARQAVDQTYERSGRYGSGAHDGAVAGAVGQLAYNDYQAELNRLDRASALAPTLAQQDYVDLDALRETGSDRENFGFNRVQRFLDLVNGNYGSSGSSFNIGNQTGTTTSRTSNSGSILGNALSLGGKLLSFL